MITTIIIFIIVLGVLVFVHEFGHFIVAKKSGMKVEEFGFGFPPRIGGIQRINGKFKFVWGHPSTSRLSSTGFGTGQAGRLDDDATIYSINWIPLGGFVKILGENNESENDPRSFINRPFKGRLLTLVAGVTMNVILAWVLMSIGLVVGLPAAVDTSTQLPKYARMKDANVSIIEVVPALPADKAGIKPGDVLEKIDNNQVQSVDQAREYIKNNAGKILSFEVKRGNKPVELKVRSTANPDPGQGPTGIALANVGKLTVPWYLSWYEGIRMVGIQIYNIVSGLYHLFTSKLGLSSLGGPIKIAQLTGEVSRMGFIYLLQFTAFLSLNLAILNILPFPALDGGRVLFLLIEKVRMKRNNQKLEQIVNTTGFLLLLMLMLLVTIKDVSSLGGVGRLVGHLFGK